MSDFLTIVLASLAGTSAMILFIETIQRVAGIHVDLVRAIGTLFTSVEKQAFFLGILLIYFIGVFFGFLYAGVLTWAPIGTLGSTMILTTLIGLIHGMVVGLILVMTSAASGPATAPGGDAHWPAAIIGSISFLIAVAAGILSWTSRSTHRPEASP